MIAHRSPHGTRPPVTEIYSIIGLILLYLALKSRLLQIEHVERGGKLLLLVMPLFFVPALSGIMDYTDFMRQSGLQVLVILVISSLLTLTGSAYIVDRLARQRGITLPSGDVFAEGAAAKAAPKKPTLTKKAAAEPADAVDAALAEAAPA